MMKTSKGHRIVLSFIAWILAVILLTCGVHGNVIRFLAPLTIPDAVFDEALDILDESIKAAGT